LKRDPIDAIAVRRVQWSTACRIVPTRHPSVYLYDRVADAADFEALYALEAMSNDRLRDEIGAVHLVAAEDRVFGPGSGPIMAAFTHLNPLGSRFSNGRYGVFHAARDRATAIAETAYHHARFLAATAEGPMHLPMRVYQVAIDAHLHDLRPEGAVPPGVFDPARYAAAQALGGALRAAGSAGVVYRSVRRRGGHCAGLFKPRGALACVQAAVLLYAWDGQRFADIYEKLET
jgi:hypothetical protein